MVVNLLMGNAMAAFAEGMALGQGLGISRKVLFDSLLGMPAVAPFLASKREKIESGNYEAEFPLRWMQKDLHLASVSEYESGVAMPLTQCCKRTVSPRNARRIRDGRFLGYLRFPHYDFPKTKTERNTMNNGTFSGKVALVTGGTSGIGKTTAIEFARAGAKVVLTGRREKEGAQVVAEIKKLGGDAAFVRADVAKDADVKAMVEFTLHKFRPARRRV